MVRHEDVFVFWILLVILLLLGLRYVSRGLGFLHAKPVPHADHPLSRLLERHGYRLIQLKTRIPITIQHEEQTYSTRLFIDGVAIQDGKRYVVKTRNQRNPVEFTGASLRDHFLTYYLLDRMDGVLYVDPENNAVHCLEFHVEVEALPRKPWDWKSPLLWIALGFVLAMLIFR